MKTLKSYMERKKWNTKPNNNFHKFCNIKALIFSNRVNEFYLRPWFTNLKRVEVQFCSKLFIGILWGSFFGKSHKMYKKQLTIAYRKSFTVTYRKCCQTAILYNSFKRLLLTCWPTTCNVVTSLSLIICFDYRLKILLNILYM